MGIISILYKNKHKERVLLRRRAFAEAKEIAHILGEKFGARKVMLYGSLAQEGRYFDSASDIDLAVRGLGRNYLKAYGHCLQLGRFDLDLKAYEDMPKETKERIARIGRFLYERK